VEMSMNHIRLYDLFRRELHLTDDKAADVVYAVQEIADLAIDSKMDTLATKEDIYSIKSEINSKIDSEINSVKSEIHSIKSEINSKINSEINSVRKDIQDGKDNIYRAIYLSGIVQFIAMIGSFLAIVKLIK
jgi:predicted  nucleic acid-binding Zn-ribbon protein